MSTDHNPWPTDAVRAAAVVAVLVCEIDMMEEEDRQELLIDLECAAWPTALSQTQ
jgi:hypothetical protein